MVQFDGDHHGSVQVRVYSLKTNSWRGMKDDAIPYFVHNLFPYGRGCGALASGALHWVAPGESGGCCVIVAFDLGVEEFRIVPQPDGVDGGSKVDVVVLEGRLCMLCNYDSGCVDVWVMKEYGLKESWTKVFEVSRDCFDVCSQSSFNRNFGQVKPLAYSKSGDKILLEVDMDKLLWYDFRRKRAERVRIEGAPIPFSADVHVESLGPLGGGGGGMDRKTQQPPEEKKKSKRKKIM
jgi:F-box interacting protein